MACRYAAFAVGRMCESSTAEEERKDSTVAEEEEEVAREEARARNSSGEMVFNLSTFDLREAKKSRKFITAPGKQLKF